MNNERRKQLSIVAALLQKAYDIIDDVYDAEEEAHENLPENMQYNSERSDLMQDAMSQIDAIRGDIESAKDELESADDLIYGDVKTDDVIKAVRGY